MAAAAVAAATPTSVAEGAAGSLVVGARATSAEDLGGLVPHWVFLYQRLLAEGDRRVRGVFKSESSTPSGRQNMPCGGFIFAFIFMSSC